MLTLLTLLTPTLATPVPQGADDFVVRSGETVVYETAAGPLRVRDLVIEEGGVLRAVGLRPLVVLARRDVVIDGLLDASGFDARDVVTLNTGNQPEPGGRGGPGAGAGGIGSSATTTSTAAGTDGLAPIGVPLGGGGGESGYAGSNLANDRRPGGGGGGVLAADQPESGDPSDPANQGLVAKAGTDGAAEAFGALTGLQPPQGGGVGASVFVDGDQTNDFWGRGLDANGDVVVGELGFPVGGRGGGAGGDAVPSDVFPQPSWTPGSDEKGGGGGGGGGLALVQARRVVIGPAGVVRADGGSGGRGENTFFLDSIGGNGGGGSGGYLVLRAAEIDLSSAGDGALSAVGGAGAANLAGDPVDGNGGDGGPGVIQLHTPEAAGVRLPVGKELADVSRPDAWSLLLR